MMMSCFVSTSRLYSRLCLLSILILLTPVCLGYNPDNVVMGLKFISFSNPDGTLKDGTCCDDPTNTAGSCPPDLCDVAFLMCGIRITPCDVFPKQTTPTTFNNNSFSMGLFIGNGENITRSVIVMKMKYKPGDVNFELTAVDGPEEYTTGFSKDIAGFTFNVNWVDPVYNGRSPHFRRFTLNDTTKTNKQLVIDVASMCLRHYYTDDCSVYCKPDKIHYTCLDNGTIECLPGWEGPNCLDMIDLCPGNNKCQNGATCVPILLNYTCTCPADFTGYHCHTSLLTTATVTTIVSTATAATAATTATTGGGTTSATTDGSGSSSGGGSSGRSGGGGDSGGGHGGSAGLIAGSVIGSVLAMCLILVAGYLVRKKLKMGKNTPCTGINEDRHGNANRGDNECAETINLQRAPVNTSV